MSKKRAFVRYTKSGEIVPGSLIITTNGGYPDKSSLWKEVTTNECCDSGGSPLSDIIVTSSSITLQECPTSIGLNINPGYDFNIQSYQIGPNILFTTYEQIVQYLNDNYSFLGEFSFTAPNKISLQVSTTGVPNFWLNTPAENWEFNVFTFACP